jgi:nucleoside-diphosphate-sugar epimerase
MPASESRRAQSFAVTGSSGFIGTHLCKRLSEIHGASSFYGIDMEAPPVSGLHSHLDIDIRCPDSLRKTAVTWGYADTVFHLAASAEVLTPWVEVPALLSSNVQGTYNVVDGLDPRLLIFASSSSVYGHAGVYPVHPERGSVQPLCFYSISKLAGEMILRDWVSQTAGSAVVFRFGNVIGPGCRGLIPYLADHMMRYPEGGVPARLRGGGRLVRDYVPVQYVVSVMLAAAQKEWNPASLVTLNVGTGRPTTNREIAEIVREVAGKEGLRLDLSFEDVPGNGEASEVVLDMENTVKLFGIAPPGPAEVRLAIAAAVLEAIKRHSKDLITSAR